MKYNIDPTSYDKKSITDTLSRNYEKQPKRDVWNKGKTNIHHYYNDWYNEKFEKVNTDTIIPIYTNVFDDFFKNIKFSIPVRYYFVIENFTVLSTEQHMQSHDHLTITDDMECIFSAIHYLKYKEDHSKTVFHNPLQMMPFDILYKHYRGHLDEFYYENSTYHNEYYLNILEDDMIIFPAYLRHHVTENLNKTDLRMASVINVYMYKDADSSKSKANNENHQ
jgi:hypothetical protein